MFKIFLSHLKGKEFEIRLKEKKPGDLSDDLRTALGMPVGQVYLFSCFSLLTVGEKSLIWF